MFYLGKKNVQWMLDANGEPWTWIMGEHKDDKTIEQIVEEEAREAARVQAEHETEQLRFVHRRNFNFLKVEIVHLKTCSMLKDI